MSLLPLLFSAWWADLQQPHMLMDQNFGLGLRPEDLRLPKWTDKYYFPQLRDGSALSDSYFRPWADLLRPDGSGSSKITADKDTFKVILDVQHFKPEEIKVKIVDRFVIVEAKHEEKKDEHGTISRQFVRKYFVPQQVDIEQLKSNISSDGVLTITAPVKELPESAKNGKVIPIEKTGKPAIRESTEKSKGVIPIEKTGKPAIRESTEKSKGVIPIEQTGKPAVRESTEKSQETSTDKTDKGQKEKEVKTEEGKKQEAKPKK